MKVLNEDKEVAGAYNVEAYLDLDVNKDNVYDFRITSVIFASHGQGWHPKVLISCLGSKNLIHGHYFDDTTFVQHLVETEIDEPNSEVSIYYSTFTSCQRTDTGDIVKRVSPNQFHVHFSGPGDYIYMTDHYESDEYRLSNDWHGSYDGPFNYAQDTVIYFIERAEYNCTSIPNNSITFIGIKIIDGDTKKLGWIKLSVSENYRAKIHETAIQK